MKLIGEILVENRLITSGQLERAVSLQSAEPATRKIGEILIDMGFLTYDTLLSYLDSQLSLR